MNEVRPTQLLAQATARPASSKGSIDTGKAQGGKELPVPSQSQPVSRPAEDVKLDLNEAVADINRYVQKVSRDLLFSVDDDSGRTVIRVVDRESGDLIRQIPEDIFLRLARNLKNNEPIHLVNAHG
ncbi:flagellar protein FlaG [Exilibacterium tricleocarpae]|uniref:Flagellar protein FlaG n=1 Tax=Exilibacterium tricleocarpae TaxID=2591008 RepID=A0A545U406_9GAMM|nr:flagellar protein FlaG [Exilibacterium tricleocarpae]TQV84143.1 flagellar protein FlaG [Exilibacterium tricleocarpae]